MIKETISEMQHKDDNSNINSSIDTDEKPRAIIAIRFKTTKTNINKQTNISPHPSLTRHQQDQAPPCLTPDRATVAEGATNTRASSEEYIGPIIEAVSVSPSVT